MAAGAPHRPDAGKVSVGKLTAKTVRAWRAGLLDRGVSVSTAAKAYRLLRAVLMTAVEEDKMISRNPCRIKGAGNEHTPERPVLTIAQVFELADRTADRRFRAMVLLTTFASLRWGEVTAVRRSSIDLQTRTVRVREQLLELDNGEMRLGPLKSKAGRRTESPRVRWRLDLLRGSSPCQASLPTPMSCAGERCGWSPRCGRTT